MHNTAHTVCTTTTLRDCCAQRVNTVHPYDGADIRGTLRTAGYPTITRYAHGVQCACILRAQMHGCITRADVLPRWLSTFYACAHCVQRIAHLLSCVYHIPAYCHIPMTDHERVLHTLTPRMQECMHTLRWMHHAAGVHISTMHGNGSTFCVHAECMRRTPLRNVQMVCMHLLCTVHPYHEA